MGRVEDVLGVVEIRKEAPGLGRALLAELFATMFLVLIGCGSAVTQGPNITEITEGSPVGHTNFVQIALGFGLTVAAGAAAIGHISGGHINPAVTVAMAVRGKIPVIHSLLYIIVQCVGAITGAAILQAVTSSSHPGALGMTALGSGVTVGQGFGVELLITFLLVWVICGVTDSERSDVGGSVPLAIGLAVTCGHLFAIPLTGSSMNPARTLGPAVMTAAWENLWVYWVGPICGAVLAALAYDFVWKQQKPRADDYALAEMTDMKA